MRNISSHLSPRLFQLKEGVLRGAIQRSNQLSVSPSKQLSSQLRSFSLRSNLSSLESQPNVIPGSDEAKPESVNKTRDGCSESNPLLKKKIEFQKLLDAFPESDEHHVEFKDKVLAFIDIPELDNSNRALFVIEISKRRFLQDKFSLDVYKAFVVQMAEWTLAREIIKHTRNAAHILNYLVPAIFKAVDPTAAEKYALSALRQLGQDEEIYEGVLNSLRKDQVPSGCTEFTVKLLEKMIELNMRPMREGFETVIFRLLSEAEGPQSHEMVQKALSIYKHSVTHCGFGDAKLYFQLIHLIHDASREAKIELISLAAAAIEQGFWPPLDTAHLLLKHLCSIAAVGVPPVELAGLNSVIYKTDDHRTNRLWSYLLQIKDIPLNDFFFVVISCYFVLGTQRKSFESRTLFQMTQSLKTIEKVNYRYLFSLLGFLGRGSIISDVLGSMKEDVLELDLPSLNALLLFSSKDSKAGNHNRSLLWFSTLAAGKRTQGHIVPDATTYALIHHSALRNKDNQLAQDSFHMALEKGVVLSPACYLALLDGILASAELMAPPSREKLLASRLLHLKKADQVIWHALDNGYRGPIWCLYCGIIRIHVSLLLKFSDGGLTWTLYQDFIQKFKALFYNKNFPAGASTYSVIFAAMAKLTFPQSKIPCIIKDIEDLYQYMLASGTPSSPLVYSHLFAALKNFNKPELSRKYYLDFIADFKTGTFNSFSLAETNMAFEAYYACDFLSVKEILSLLSGLPELSPLSPGPMLAAMASHHARKAPWADLKLIMLSFCKFFTRGLRDLHSYSYPVDSKVPINSMSQVDSNFLIKLSTIVVDAGGLNEMSLALNYFIKSTLSPSEITGLHPSFYTHMVKALLSSPTRENFDHALDWLIRMKTLESIDTKLQMGQLLQDADALLSLIDPTDLQRNTFENLKDQHNHILTRSPPK